MKPICVLEIKHLTRSRLGDVHYSGRITKNSAKSRMPAEPRRVFQICQEKAKRNNISSFLSRYINYRAPLGLVLDRIQNCSATSKIHYPHTPVPAKGKTNSHPSFSPLLGGLKKRRNINIPIQETIRYKYECTNQHGKGGHNKDKSIGLYFFVKSNIHRGEVLGGDRKAAQSDT